MNREIRDAAFRYKKNKVDIEFYEVALRESRERLERARIKAKENLKSMLSLIQIEYGEVDQSYPELIAALIVEAK